MTALEFFSPAVDRHDRRSAARLFQLLWPDAAVARAAADHLAASVRAAHAAAEASWSVTMLPHRIRLNVGQVETLTFSEAGARFLFSVPLHFSSSERFHIALTDTPAYPSVPVPSGVCFVLPSELAALPASVRNAHEAYIRAAASFKRSSPFKRSFSPSVLEHVESILGINLPRPSYMPRNFSSHEINPLPEEIDCNQPLVEGATYRVTVNAYERDPRARQICIANWKAVCVICGFSFGATYGPVAEGLIHVHHLRPLSEIGGEYEVDPVNDLRPVCANCHAVLHRRVPAFSIEEVRAFLSQQRQATFRDI